MSSTVVTRFAPSPSGALHLGNARTAFFSHLWARAAGGRFILRVEDTDVERSAARFREALLTDLAWLGLDWDEGPDLGGPGGPYVQSERGGFYAALFARLQESQAAYPCFCTPEELELSRKLQRMAGKPPRYAGTCRRLDPARRAQLLAAGRPHTLRFAVPAATAIEFVDLVHGAQQFASEDIGDFIVRREDGSAAFFFSNAVDDSAMGVTHVLRGDDHLTNTPRQLLLLDALGLRRPAYGHVGLLIGADGAPLSKRHGSSSVNEFREAGFLAAAVLNQLFHLGHASDVDGWLEPARMPGHFHPDRLGRASARFDPAQLEHWQKETLQRMNASELQHWLGADDPPEFIELVRNNVVLPADAERWRSVVRGELEPLGAEEAGIVAAAGAPFFAAAAAALSESGSDAKRLAALLKARTGRKGAELFMPLRVALTGRSHGPELAPLLRLMGAEIARSRLEQHAQNS